MIISNSRKEQILINKISRDFKHVLNSLYADSSNLNWSIN